jgi:hypothetical protein
VARSRRGDDDHGVTKIAAIAFALFLAACTGTWGNPGHSRTTRTALTVAYATSTTIQACDVGQTLWTSHGGRWDRTSPDNPRMKLAEMNPLLGHEPSQGVLAGFAVLNAVAGYVLLEAPLPAWVKGLWFGGLTAVETTMVVGNFRYGGACGLANQRDGGFQSAPVAR